MKNFLIIWFVFSGFSAGAQVTLSGKVTDRKGDPVVYANVYLEGSYEGTSTDPGGSFLLTTRLTGRQLLVVSFIGYEKKTVALNLGSADTSLIIVMEEIVSELDEVAITAGVFSASDKKKSATLNSMDIATTASAMGDIYGAYATMPGSQKVGEEGLLFVRGGEGYETRTYMDGMPVQTPYFSRLPDIPTRGRFSPLLFSETLFSTGGYSAEFGNALSSVVDLTTTGLETEDKASVSLMSVGANASLTRSWENSSVAMTGLYADNVLTDRIFRQEVDWIDDPVLADGMILFRHRVGGTGLLKSFCSYNFNKAQMYYDNIETGSMDRIGMKNHSFHTNLSYSGEAGERWLIRTGGSFSRDDESIRYNQLPVRTLKSAASLKLVMTHLTSEKVKVRMGGEMNRESYLQALEGETAIEMELSDLATALFLESEVTLTGKLALRLGARSEYSSLTGGPSLLPRVSAAYKTGQFSQVSLAWGKYTQRPQYDYLKFAPGLVPEKAGHYVLNYQYRRNSRIFRVESYLKTYRDLVKYGELYNPEPLNYNNDGRGYAAGADLFWRDTRSVKGGDYWISYSFLRTIRDYRDYPFEATPHFASAHNLSMVYKQFITPISTFAGLTYSYASPRPFDNRNSDQFMDGRTRSYHDLSINLTYLTRLFGQECIIHLTLNNLPGFRNVYGYRYAATRGEDGLFASQPIVPVSRRMAVLLVMLSL